MSDLDAARIRGMLNGDSTARLDSIEVFESIDSTNSYLLRESAPGHGRCRVAIADYQTAGRGRHDREWISSPGSGLCLSIAYAYPGALSNMSSMTLALGVGAINAFSELGIDGVSLKWPNDIVARGGKVGGILTESQQRSTGGVLVVAGVGINMTLPPDVPDTSDWASEPVDVARLVDNPPSRESLSVALIDEMLNAASIFEAHGFDAFAERWTKHDWLRGRDITIDTPGGTVQGIATGVDKDGALLIDNGKGEQRVIAGSIATASATRRA